jgi:hypothetical protein
MNLLEEMPKINFSHFPFLLFAIFIVCHDLWCDCCATQIRKVTGENLMLPLSENPEPRTLNPEPHSFFPQQV